MPTKKKPSPAQLAARAKFVAMVRAKSKAKKSATKKVTVKKAAPKKAAKKKVATKKASTHKDTKSHNVRINVVSGTNNIDRLKQAIKIKESLENNLKIFRTVTPKNRSSYQKLMIKALPQLIAGEKRIISELKKHIK